MIGACIPALFCIVRLVCLLHYITHHLGTVLETDFVSSSHFSSGSIAHAVEYLVEHINLLLTQRILKGNTELVELVRELSGLNIALSVIMNESVKEKSQSRISIHYLT